ncbi:pleiotropic drug resistance protein 3 [Quercus suber]|uniref:Pleiotropic drug resistance protein 3 n=1 Tax=Quercus suber TaxID=58331 RepID=A0AAW0M4C4_QUESU
MLRFTIARAARESHEPNVPNITREISYNGYKLEEFVPQKTSSYISQNDLHIYEMTYVVKVLEAEQILALDICADTLVGNAMRRGISGGEMIVGPTKALFMDEITNGLDSSTAFQIVTCLQQMAHITDATVLVSLLQPAPETFDLFDDLILMSEGKIVYHGPRDHVLEYFEDWGFRCPERKGVADFVQEVISRKDQAQYWYHMEVPYSYVSIDMFSRKFKESPYGKKLDEELSEPYDKSQSHKDALSFSVYSLSKWELFRVCASREILLMKRNSFIYIFKTTQTQMDIDVLHANYYMGALFYSLNILLVDGLPELAMTLQRLELGHMQSQQVPLSFVESLVWTSFTYYVIGYSPEAKRFFCQFILLFAVHLSSLSMFRFLALVFRTHTSAMTVGSLAVFLQFVFVERISKPVLFVAASMPVWLKWGFCVSPLTYGELGLSLNEFLAPRWQKMLSTNATIGQEILKSRGLYFDGYLYWISLGALFVFTIVFNIGYILALSFLKSPGSSRAIISHEKLSEIQGSEDSHDGNHRDKKSRNSPPPTSIETKKGRRGLPFTPLTVAFQDVQYYVDTPLVSHLTSYKFLEMRENGFTN